MAPRGADDRAFDWPPTDTDLADIDIVSTAAVTAAGVGVARHPASPRRRHPAEARRFGRLDGLMLLAAGMLLGSAVPSLDTAPPTRIGVREAAGNPTLMVPGRSPSLASAPGPRTAPSSAANVSPAATHTHHESHPSAAPSAAAGAVITTRLPATTARPRMPTDPRAQQVVAVVQAYGRAWSRMDARATRAVMPSADVTALTRDFTAMREQRLTLTGCRVSGTGGTAVASCTVTRRYRPRQGDHSTRVERGRWQFRMQRTAQRWVIAGVEQG